MSIVMICFFLLSMFFLFSLEEKLMMCMIFMFYLIFLFWSGDVMEMGLLLDSLSFSMIYLTLVLMMIVFVSVENLMKKHYFLCLSMTVVVFFFLVDNIYLFFIFFELSLVPVFFLISFWGVQPERVKAIKFMMIYTLIASSPFLLFTISMSFGGANSFSFFIWEKFHYFLVFSSFMAFWVKIPLFFFHSWLPKAHVEAPLEGSMILAGVMLKVGMYGIVRLMSVYMYVDMFYVVCFFFCLGLIGSMFSMMIAVSSDDMKMSVAFSSISHMNLCISSLASMKVSSLEAWVLIMISHGLCSPMMFFWVTKIYTWSGSRSMIVSKGIASKFPFFQFLGFLIWSMNISAPPSMSFLGEVNVIFSIYSVYLWGAVIVLFYFIFSSFFSMFNYGVQSHSCNSIELKKGVSVMVFSNVLMYSFSIVILHFFFSEVFM